MKMNGLGQERNALGQMGTNGLTRFQILHFGILRYVLHTDIVEKSGKERGRGVKVFYLKI